MFRLNYIGSKKKLVNFIVDHIQEELRPDDIFCDLFSGTGIIPYTISVQNPSNKIIANDLMAYSYIITSASLAYYTKSDIKDINNTLQALSNIEPRYGFIARHYAPPKRMYFTKENAAMIDGLRSNMEDLSAQLSISKRCYHYILANIIASADRIANVPSLYASYLKKFKTSALQPLNMPNIYEDNHIRSKRNKVYNMDANELVRKHTFDVVYIDPPYNQRQYADNYHILETIAKYDNPEIKGKTGLPKERTRSHYCTRNHVKETFSDLIHSLHKKKTRVILVSYNNEGLLSHRDIDIILKQDKQRSVRIVTLDYKTFKNHKGIDYDKDITEYLFISKIL